MAKIYGLFFGAHGQSTTLIVDGEVKYAIEDERITRKKAGNSWWDSPISSLKAIEDKTGILLEDADIISISDPTLLYLVQFGSGLSSRDEMDSFRNRLIKLKDKIQWVEHHEAHAYSTYYNSGFNGKTLVLTSDGGSYEKEYGTVWLAENGKMTKVHSIPLLEQGSIANLWFSRY